MAKKKNENGTEEVGQILETTPSDVAALMEQERKNRELFKKTQQPTTTETTTETTTTEAADDLSITQVAQTASNIESAKVETTNVAKSTEPMYDEEGNLINPPSQEAVSTSTTPTAKSSLAKLLKSNFEDIELDETDDDEKAISIVKKLKEERDLSLLALKGEEEFNNSEEAKMIVGFINLSDEEKYKSYIVSTKIQAGYSQEYAIKAAEKEIEKAKLAVEDGEDDVIAIEAARLTNLARQDYNNHRKTFADKRAEALKINLSQSSITERIKDVKDILAKSDTFLGITFTKPAKKQEYVNNTMKLIESGEYKKLLNDPNELSEFLLWKANRTAYEARLQNMGRIAAIHEKSSNPTITGLGSAAPNTPVNHGKEKKFNVSGW